MLVLWPEAVTGSFSRILCLGAHADDIEIGCGGTVLKLLQIGGGRISVDWVVLSAPGRRSTEANRGAETFLRQAKAARVIIEDFRMSYFPYVGAELKERFDALGREVSPDLVLTHNGDDVHQDHRVVSELTWNTFRDHLILEYEIPKYDGDLGRPNVFVHLDEETSRLKVDSLLAVFESQRSKPWFSEDLFMAMLRLRGMESRSPSGFAEAFYGRKLVLA
jgi:LmbE family N-acetylglucosaminyl deacetylase